MGRYVRIILFDALMAAVIVALYSPSMLALRPTDPSLLRAGLSVFLGILIAASLVWVNASALREPKVHMLEGDGAIDVDEVREVLNTCVSDRSVGRFARDGLRELDEANNISGLLLEKIVNKFGEGSMTYDRYASVVQGAHNAIISNTAKKKELDVFVLAVTGIIDKGSRMYIAGEKARWLQDAFPNEEGELHSLQEGLLSRKKQIVPKVTDAISKYA